MHFTLLTLFPEMFPGPLAYSLAGKALENGIWSYQAVNIRDYATDKHQHVDDTPYGGGAGMVLRADILAAAIRKNVTPGTRLLYPSPRGAIFSQTKALELAETKNVAILCGRFEGIDERILENFDIEEISMGDYILSGGEIASLTIMDACIRLLPGVVGTDSSLSEESFGTGGNYEHLLEYPLYTRPATWETHDVPEILLSGHHENIRAWRLEKAKALTQKRRPDVWEKYQKANSKTVTKR